MPLRPENAKDFDNLYTAPVHGYLNAEDYYTKNSPINNLERINIPLKILNALNDSFLSKACIPIDLAQRSKNIYLEAQNMEVMSGSVTLKGPITTKKESHNF